MSLIVKFNSRQVLPDIRDEWAAITPYIAHLAIGDADLRKTSLEFSKLAANMMIEVAE